MSQSRALHEKGEGEALRLCLRELDDLEPPFERVADSFAVSGSSLVGINFPLATVAEGLYAASRYYGEQSLVAKHSQVCEFLAESTERSGFAYFERSKYPPDLDTAASLVRVLWRFTPQIVDAYDEIVHRNRLDNGLVPTWLDCNQEEWLRGGSHPFHVDVLMNYWLTEASLGRMVDGSVVLGVVRMFGLGNYWYLPPLYTPYLYARLLKQLEWFEEPFVETLVSVLDKYDSYPEEYLSASNVTRFPEVATLVREAWSPMFNEVFRRAILALVPTLTPRTSVSLLPTPTILLGVPSEEGLYWSLQFRPFRSCPVASAIVIQGLLASSGV